MVTEIMVSAASKTALTRDVVNYHSDRRISNVRWNETAEPLLASSVPQLQPNLYTIKCLHELATYPNFAQFIVHSIVITPLALNLILTDKFRDISDDCANSAKFFAGIKHGILDNCTSTPIPHSSYKWIALLLDVVVMFITFCHKITMAKEYV